MATKTLNTRIQLKYDSWAEWQKVAATFKPLKGELCIVDPGTATGSVTNTPCLLKVGDGENFFSALPWVSAPAADVHEWAKASDVRLKNQKLEFFTGDNVIKTVDLSTFITEEEVEAILAGYKKVQDPVTDPTANGKSLTFIDTISQNAQGVITATKKNVNLDDYALKTEIPTELGVMSVNKKDGTAIEVDNTDPKNPKVGFTIDPTAGDVTLTQTNSGLKANLNKTAAGLDQVENKSTAAIKEQFTGAVADGNTGFVTGDAVHDAIATAVEELTVGAHVYEVTTPEHSNLTVTPKTVDNKTTFDVDVTVPKLISNLSGFPNRLSKTDWGLCVNQDIRIVYNESTMTYTIYQHQGSANANNGSYTNPEFIEVEIGQITIPKDMVVESGRVVENPTGQAEGTYIELKLQHVDDPIYINVGSLIEYVTSGSKTGDMVVVDIDAEHKVTATITDGTVTKAKLFSTVQTSLDNADTAYGWGDHAQEGYLKAGDIANKADKVTGATAGNFAGLDANGNLTDSGKKVSDFATTAQGDRADSAIRQISIFEGGGGDEIVEGAISCGLNTFPTEDGNSVSNRDWIVLNIGLKEGGVTTAALADNAVNEDKIDDTLLAKINGKVTTITADTGLTATRAEGSDAVTIGLDETTTFIFNCGDSKTLIS